MKLPEINYNLTKVTQDVDEQYALKYFNHTDQTLANITEDMIVRNKETFTMNTSEHYSHFEIRKKSDPSKKRPIDAPDLMLKNAQGILKTYIEDQLKALPHKAAHAYVENRSTVTAMKMHQKNESKWFLQLDLSNFFNSINEDFMRKMLSQASQADTAIAPSADMFEIGAKVQVLKKGTLFPMRAQKLYNIYCAYQNIDEIPEKERKSLETTIFRDSLENIWLSTKKFFETADPEMIKKAESSPKFKMALIFRSYLGQSAKWSIVDQEDRRIDFQIWCGPAIGTFNQWCKGSFMEDYKNRKVADVALNILYGTAVYQRLLDLRRQGIELFSAIDLKPRENIII